MAPFDRKKGPARLDVGAALVAGDLRAVVDPRQGPAAAARLVERRQVRSTHGVHRRTHRARTIAAGLGAALHGITDELHQVFTRGRSPDVFEVLADFVGALLCALACVAIVARKTRAQMRASAPARVLGELNPRLRYHAGRSRKIECCPTRGRQAKSCRRRGRSKGSSWRPAAPSCAPSSVSCGARGSTCGPSPTPRAPSRRPAAPTRHRADRRSGPAVGRYRPGPPPEGQRPHAFRSGDPLHAERSAAGEGARAGGGGRRGVRARDGRGGAARPPVGVAADAGAVPPDRPPATHAAQRDRRPPAMAFAVPARSEGPDRRAGGQRRVPRALRPRRQRPAPRRVRREHRGHPRHLRAGEGLRQDRPGL